MSNESLCLIQIGFRKFLTIAKAVEYAYPGYLIWVHKGTCCERVNPIRGGRSDSESTNRVKNYK